MQAIPRLLAEGFAEEFAGKKKGFSAREITDYFAKYSNLVTPYDHYGINPTRHQLFIESLYALAPKLQYYSLNDLTWREYPCKYTYPSGPVRNELRHQLHGFISVTPIGIHFSELRETAYREDWVTCHTRIAGKAYASAITSARTMLETLLKSIVQERGGAPDRSADLQRLFREAQDAMGFDRASQQSEHQVLQGLVSVVNGLSTISNAAGDRHGQVGGKAIDDPYIAGLCVNAAGTVGLAMIEMHLFSPTSDPESG